MCVFKVSIKIFMGHRFNQYFASVIGLGYLGSSFGAMASAPVFQVLLDLYGWRGTFLLIGGLLLHFIVFGAAFTSYPHSTLQEDNKADENRIGDDGKYGKLLTCDDTEDKNEEEPSRDDDGDEKATESLFSNIMRTITNLFDLNLFLNIDYLEMVILFSAEKLCSMAWFVYYQDNARAKGATPYQAASLYTSLEIAMLSSQTIGTLLVDRSIVPIRGVLIFCFVLLSTVMLCEPLIHSYFAMIGGSIVYGLGFGPTRPLFYALVKKTVVPARLAKAFALLPCVPGIVRLCFGPIGGRFVMSNRTQGNLYVRLIKYHTVT